MTRFALLLFPALLGGCASAGLGGSEPSDPEALWVRAHTALYRSEFARADSAFAVLTTEYPATGEGREAIFFRAVVRLDPRNPGWNPAPAAERLRSYLAQDSTFRTATYPRPEARTLLRLAEQLALPPEERMAGLGAQTRTQLVEVPGPERVAAPAAESRALAAEVERLRRELATRDDTIRRQREELNRIRNALTPRQP